MAENEKRGLAMSAGSQMAKIAASGIIYQRPLYLISRRALRKLKIYLAEMAAEAIMLNVSLVGGGSSAGINLASPISIIIALMTKIISCIQ